MQPDNLTICATADLHYNIRRSREPTEELARLACDTAADVLVLAGDTAGADLGALRDCLGLFDGFAGPKLLVPGNHCLWCAGGENSLTRYRHTLPAAAAEMGFVLLDHNPQICNGVGLVGSIGWYDYSFRDERLGIPLPFYQAKIAPGAAAYYSEHKSLLADHLRELDDSHTRITSRWMDGVHVHLGITDEQFVDELAATLGKQLTEMARQADPIVVITHHLPFAKPLPERIPAKYAFAAAFMGSKKLGDVIAAEPKVTHVLCGHSHYKQRWNTGGIEVINIGSTYTEKHMELLTI